MSEVNKAVARRLIEEIWNQGNLAAIDEVLAPNYVGQAPPEVMKGREGYRELVKKYRASMSDFRFHVDDLLADGDKVVIRWTCTGTHDGELAGIPPTGKSTKFTGIAVARLENGMIAEEFASWDALGLLQQIGAIPG